ncbi:MAG: hypothetical protein COU31_00685 [Candidatus Magasanikbacteria bacterium CG10_big_fil_rev_8_21_14_0_10_40_10]|uniref:YprB ribonuclease H-like domain-containing protein n=1 Tax=Candidatus Magasanikbacteria bacterium CG10_big_fil_rev_8_21_14_0_10_40_10 TaxID=1974648 RepID=A0A2M6W4V6_9BACT|nr:MAG: hypothetical protein COU31_00685 [Candidatus Magasanikbacteria bacterium CG10_big_fil_rev_8_21_14_0_10_40_10]
MLTEIVFDIETQNSFSQVNNDFRLLKVSVISIYSPQTKKFQSFTENEIGQLWPIFEKADLLIGYNSEHFDLPILNNYYPGNLLEFPHLDLMKEVQKSIGRRIKLNDLAVATLDNVAKSADGLQAIKWYQEGKIDEIKKYCEQDVNITWQIYDFGLKHRQLFYKTLTGETLPFAVDFSLPNNESLIKGDSNQKSINLTLPL